MPRVRRPKLTIDQVKKAFDKRGDKLITRIYIGTKQELLYRCGVCKGLCTTDYNRYVSHGCGCKFCSMMKRINPKNKTRQKIVLRTQFFNMQEVCRIFGFDYGHFQRHVVLGLLPRGTKKIGAKLYYSENDIRKIRNLVYLDCDEVKDLTTDVLKPLENKSKLKAR